MICRIHCKLILCIQRNLLRGCHEHIFAHVLTRILFHLTSEKLTLQFFEVILSLVEVRIKGRGLCRLFLCRRSLKLFAVVGRDFPVSVERRNHPADFVYNLLVQHGVIEEIYDLVVIILRLRQKLNTFCRSKMTICVSHELRQCIVVHHALPLQCLLRGRNGFLLFHEKVDADRFSAPACSNRFERKRKLNQIGIIQLFSRGLDNSSPEVCPVTVGNGTDLVAVLVGLREILLHDVVVIHTLVQCSADLLIIDIHQTETEL